MTAITVKRLRNCGDFQTVHSWITDVRFILLIFARCLRGLKTGWDEWRRIICTRCNDGAAKSPIESQFNVNNLCAFVRTDILRRAAGRRERDKRNFAERKWFVPRVVRNSMWHSTSPAASSIYHRGGLWRLMRASYVGVHLHQLVCHRRLDRLVLYDKTCGGICCSYCEH